MKTFRKYNPEQLSLMPPAIQDWLPEGHLALFVSNVVDTLDLSEFYAAYDGTKGGQPPYHPLMMVKLFCFAYCVGIQSSRQMERATWESVPFRVLAAGEHPDHASLAEFRKRHLTALSNLFPQILEIAMNAQLVDLDHVAIDGTKVKANADRNKNYSVESATKREDRIKAHIKEMLEKGIQLDKEEDEKYGDRSSYLLPKELRSKEAQMKI
jgi:transposase